MPPLNAQERAQEKDHEDARDEWVVCPECGSADAVVITLYYDAHAACPDCGASREIYAE